MEQGAKETWVSGEAYEKWVGRWSRPVAAHFIDWLDVPERSRWADVGCGTGALSAIILASRQPAAVCGIDRSAGFIAVARETGRGATFDVGDATALPWDDASFDAAVSGLVLNFVPDHEAMAREMKRVTRPGGTVAAYVWDDAGGMQMMRHFWDVAIQLNPADTKSDRQQHFRSLQLLAPAPAAPAAASNPPRNPHPPAARAANAARNASAAPSAVALATLPARSPEPGCSMLVNSYFMAYAGGIVGAVLMDITESLAARAGLTSGVSVSLVGRWALGLLRGQWRHDDIAHSPAQPREVAAGWVFHFLVGGGAVALLYAPLVEAAGWTVPAHRLWGGVLFARLTNEADC